MFAHRTLEVCSNYISGQLQNSDSDLNLEVETMNVWALSFVCITMYGSNLSKGMYHFDPTVHVSSIMCNETVSVVKLSE